MASIKFTLCAALLGCLSPMVQAIPLFARQTGMECVQCHSGGNFPELSSFGRSFKLTGYTLGTRQSIPLSGMLVLGLTLNNNPTVADPFNTVPAWKHPYFEPGGAFQGFGAQPLLMDGLGQVTAGLGAYADWNGMVYAELAGYRNASGILSPLRAGNINKDPNSGGTGPHIVSGTSPYWRLALHGDHGAHAWMAGMHGLNANTLNDTYDSASPMIKIRDKAFDAQYQYTAGDHYVTAQGMWSRERQNYDPAMVGAGAGFDNAGNTLNWRQMRLAYTYQNKYGISASAFGSTGSSDAQLYSEHTNTVPDTKGTILEATYMLRKDMKLGLMYVAYTELNGSSSNYDASGTFTNRNAKDNNTLGLYFWTAF